MRTFLVAVSCVVLSGCVQNGPNQAYYTAQRDPVAELRESSYNQADAMAASLVELRKAKNDSELFEVGKKVVANLMKDPSSVQFRNMKVVTRSKGTVVCGEVNGKNSYGAYVGFKKFVAGQNEAHIEESGGRYEEVDYAANAGIRAWCVL